ASVRSLRHPMSVDLYVESVIEKSRAVLVRCLGGLEYWRYGLERIGEVARARGLLFAALPGDDRPDDRLAALSTVDRELAARLDACLRTGGAVNALEVLRLLAARLDGPGHGPPPRRPPAALRG